MKRTLTVVGLLVLALVLASSAQAWYPGGWRMGPGPGWCMTYGGWANIPVLNPNPQQIAQWSELQNQWLAELLPLRNQLLSKRLELQSLLLQRDADPQAIKNKQQEIIALEAQLREKQMNHWLAFRQTLTPEQLSLWTAGRMPGWGAGYGAMWPCPLGLGPGMGLGRGMGWGMGPGRGPGRGWNR